MPDYDVDMDCLAFQKGYVSSENAAIQISSHVNE